MAKVLAMRPWFMIWDPSHWRQVVVCCCHFDVPGPQRMPNTAAWWPDEKLYHKCCAKTMICVLVGANLLSICVWSDRPFQILEQQIHQLKHDHSVSCNSQQFSKTNTSFIISYVFLVYKWSPSWLWGESICCLTGLSSRKSWTSFCTSRKLNAKCRTD